MPHEDRRFSKKTYRFTREEAAEEAAAETGEADDAVAVGHIV